MNSKAENLQNHPVVSREEWLVARKELLAKEKDFTRQRDQLSQQRRALPWVRLDKSYSFVGPDGPQTLADLFAGKSQLLVYHFMFAPEAAAGCPHCSFWADNFNGIPVHLAQRDTALVAISRAPIEKLQAFARRMGWGFKWLSSGQSDFNYDFQVSFSKAQLDSGRATYNYVEGPVDHTDREGVSAFYRDPAGTIFHTYSSYARGIDLLNTAYNYLDLVAKGRDESGLEFTQSWVRHHDKYAG